MPSPVPAQMWAGVSPVSVQMWARGEPGPGADVARGEPRAGRACPHRVVALGARRLCLEHDERVQEQVEAPELEEPLKPRRRPRRQRHAQREEHLPH